MEYLDNETIKSIASEIIEEESKRINKKITIHIITRKEYYRHYIFKEAKSQILASLTQPVKSGAFNDPKGNIVIFLDKINKITSHERKIFATTLYSYHEVKHTEQRLLDRYSYDRFIFDLENYLIGEKKINYKTNHNNILFEIDANIYAINKTKEYLSKKYPEVYLSVKDEISKFEKKYLNKLEEYDSLSIVEQIINYMRYQLRIHLAESVSSMEIISPVLELFLYSDVTFKPLSIMMKDEKFQKLDKRIIYLFLSSKQFLEGIQPENISKEELILIKESLEYTNNIYLHHNKSKDNLNTQKNISKQLLSKRKSIKEEIKKTNRINNILNYQNK